MIGELVNCCSMRGNNLKNNQLLGGNSNCFMLGHIALLHQWLFSNFIFTQQCGLSCFFILYMSYFPQHECRASSCTDNGVQADTGIDNSAKDCLIDFVLHQKSVEILSSLSLGFTDGDILEIEKMHEGPWKLQTVSDSTVFAI